jgi:hypothetical protein
MNRYNELKLQVLSLFAATQGEWLGPNEAAKRLNFLPNRSAWTYFKRLWGFGLLERRSRGRGTLEYRITELASRESEKDARSIRREVFVYRRAFRS